jgi:hypothetical protein
MSNPLQRVTDTFRPFNEAASTAKTAWDSFWGILSMLLWSIPLLLGGAWLVDRFKDDLPKGLVDFVQSIMGFFKDMIAKIPGIEKIPFLGEWIGKAARERVLGMTPGNLNEELAKTFPREVAQAVATNKSVFDAFLKSNPSINPLALTSKVGITALLLDENGRKVVGHMLTGFEAARKPGGSLASGGNATEDQKKAQANLQSTLKDVLKDSQAFGQIWSNPDAKALLLRGASMASSVGFRGDGARALETFFNQPNMNVEAQRTLMLAMAENPVQALSDLASTQLKPGGQAMDPTAIQNLAAVIDPASVATESRQALQLISQNGAQIITNIRQLPEPTRLAIAAGGAQAKIGVISYLASPHATPEIVASIANTASADQLPNGPMRQLLSNEAGAQSVIALGRGLGSQVFTPLATSLASGKFEVAGITAQNYPVLKKFAAEVVALSENGKPLAEWNNPQNAGHAALSTLRLVKDSDFKTFDAVAKVYAGMNESGRAAIARLQQANTQGQQAVVAALFDDNTRAALMTPGNRAALGTLISTLPATGGSPLARITPQSGSGDQNLTAMLTLIDTIDKNTGSDRNAAEERRADATNAKAMNFLLQFAIGNKPAADKETIQAVSALFSKQENVEAFGNFLKTIDVRNLTQPQQAFVQVLKDNWYIDSNNNGTFDAAESSLFLTSHDSGLAAYLANPNAAGIILKNATGKSGGILEWMSIPLGSFVSDPSLKAIREAAAKLVEGTAQAVSPPTKVKQQHSR